MSEPGLKPCPFCGGEPKIVSENNFHTVFCYRCLGNSVKTRVTKFGDPELAFAAWNHRAGEAALEYMLGERGNENDMLRKEVERMKHENFKLWEALQFRKTAEELLRYVEQTRKGGEG